MALDLQQKKHADSRRDSHASALEPRYTFHAADFHRKENKLGQVYTALARYLHKKRSSDWCPKTAASALLCDLIIGENQAGGIEWRRLGSHGVKPLVNYCRGFQALTRKALMAQSLRSYSLRMLHDTETSKENIVGNAKSEVNGTAIKGDINLDDFVPKTFIFSSKKQEQEEFVAEYARRRQQGLDNTWILKPSGGAHGDNIVVMREEAEILDFISNMTMRGAEWVVQKYLENPLLLPGGRKFDIRCMVLVGHDYSIYLYSEGVLRTCSVTYSLEDLSNRFAHLANHCLQEQHPAYGSHAGEPDNLMPFSSFDSFLRQASAHTDRLVTLDTHILPQIEKQVVYSLLAVKDDMEVPESASYRSFHLLGFDFMLDDRFNVYLVEVNASPTTDPKFIPKLVEEVVRVAIDPLLPPQTTGLCGPEQATSDQVKASRDEGAAEATPDLVEPSQGDGAVGTAAIGTGQVGSFKLLWKQKGC